MVVNPDENLSQPLIRILQNVPLLLELLYSPISRFFFTKEHSCGSGSGFSWVALPRSGSRKVKATLKKRKLRKFNI
jgi:hypothetical protein